MKKRALNVEPSEQAFGEMAEVAAESEEAGVEVFPEVVVSEVLGEEEKMDRIRAVRFPVIQVYADIVRSVYPLFVKKGAKVKTEIHEKEIPHLIRALAFNPSEEQIEQLLTNARFKEVNQTTKGHFQYDNFEQRVMEHLFNEPNAFKRHPEGKIKEAMLTISKGENEIDANELKVRHSYCLFCFQINRQPNSLYCRI